MAKFKVLRRVDAFVDYVAEVEASSAEEAAQRAEDNEERYDWEKVDVQHFDARLFVTLDQDGNELEHTQTGDFG